MSVDYELYKTFLSVASNKSFTKAANELFVSQPSISQAISKLETVLQYDLFVREGKRISLTEKGKQLYEFLIKGEHYFKNAESFINFKVDHTRKIVFAASQSLSKIFILPKIKNILAKDDKTNIEVLDSNSSKERILAVESGDLDFAIMEENSAKNISTNLIAKTIGSLTYAFIFNKQFFNISNNIKLEELLNQYVIIAQNIGSKARILFNEKAAHIGEPKKLITVYYEENVIEAVKLGVGVGFAPIEYIYDKNFAILPLGQKEVKIVLVYKYKNNDIATLL